LDTLVAVQMTHQLTTHYTLLNTSKVAVPCLYVDHAADSSHGGYAINTTDKVVKAATGYARFQLALAAEEQVEFDVTEVAIYETVLYGASSIEQFLTKELEKMAPGAVGSDVVQQLRRLQRERSARECLDQASGIGSVAPKAIGKFIDRFKQLAFPKAFVELLESFAKIVVQVRQCEADISSVQESQRGIVSDQERLRSNISSLSEVSGDAAVQCYVQQLVAQEQELKTLAAQLTQLKVALATARETQAGLDEQIREEAKRLGSLPVLITE